VRNKNTDVWAGEMGQKGKKVKSKKPVLKIN
jgi:hypothetical protein